MVKKSYPATNRYRLCEEECDHCGECHHFHLYNSDPSSYCLECQRDMCDLCKGTGFCENKDYGENEICIGKGCMWGKVDEEYYPDDIDYHHS